MNQSDSSGLLWRTPAWLEFGRYAVAAAIVLGLAAASISLAGPESQKRMTSGPEDATLLDLMPESVAPAAPSAPPLEPPPAASNAMPPPPEAEPPEGKPPEADTPALAPVNSAEATSAPPPRSEVTPPAQLPSGPAREEQAPQEAAPAGSQPEIAAPVAVPSEPRRRAAGLTLSQWQKALLGRLEKAKGGINAGSLSGTVMVEFTAGRNGQLLSAAISRSSGSPALDQKALTLVRRAAPFPAPPADIPAEALRFSVPVAFLHGH